jgi:alkanesulfonate monooxygenase SsuD/methylene tetrahydromethanopterin reductase-like flavin-dependent oxidoreductase (luciferase family)
VRFGVLIPQEGASFDAVLAHARLAEALGFDSVWVEDHLRVIAVPPGSPAYEGWTTLTALLARTERVRCGPLVLAEAFRNPAWLANAAATLDRLSGGRLLLGMGAGGYEAEYRSYGYPWTPARERVARLEEALQVIQAMWERRPFEGRHYRCDGTADCPEPLQRPRPPLWVGGRSDAILGVAARHADVWNAPLLAPEEVAERAACLHRLAEEAGRATPEISVYVPVWMDEDAERMERRLARARASENRNVRLYARVAVSGTPDQVVARLRAYAEVRVTHVVCHFGRADVTRGTELFARTVMPALR